MRSSSAVINGVVYVGSSDGYVYVLKASDGQHIWSYKTGASWGSVHDGVPSSPAVAGGIVYVGAADFNVYALNATTGANIWSYTTSAYGAKYSNRALFNGAYSSPAVVDGIVYVGSIDKTIYALGFYPSQSEPFSLAIIAAIAIGAIISIGLVIYFKRQKR